MAIESALYDHLVAAAAVTALVSTRIFPDTAPQDVTEPYVTFQVVSAEHDRHLTAGGGLVAAGVQIDVWASTSLSRRAIVDALFARLHGFAGAMGDEALAVRSVSFNGPTNTYDEPVSGDESGVYRGRVEATIWHVEAVPTF